MRNCTAACMCTSLIARLLCAKPSLCVTSTGVSEADADLQDLVHMHSGEGTAERAASSSEEDISDEAFAARHAVLEAEERQKFNSYAGELS